MVDHSKYDPSKCPVYQRSNYVPHCEKKGMNIPVGQSLVVLDSLLHELGIILKRKEKFL